MYVVENRRNQGLASLILEELENWAIEMNYNRLILETGKKQIGAKELYLKNGFIIIPNYGQYAGIDNSICFEKNL
jgi:GNAT superfamily N-acetyltransferase